MTVSERLHQWGAWYDDRPVRERGLILVTALIVVVLGVWQFSLGPTLAQIDTGEARFAQKNASLAGLNDQAKALAERAEKDPNTALRDRIDRRQSRLSELDGRISEATGALVSPRAMVGVLEEMLSSQQNLTLVRLRLLEPMPIRAPGGHDAGSAETVPLMYAHDVEVTVRGGYLPLLDYLRRLEALQRDLSWRQLDYKVLSHPDAEATLRIRTLGLEPAWLGV
ncbi:MSHA biogenesis protein MshJ [Tamilnaduibacter salinus]|uniref:MSHA biogenesis protein MshJ n=1 Tax=Tamilnaduibacter salinus TaxID=1484056 RepID=A0A2U1CTZ1_9GAMM|nr:type II secretion system protein GspM [Tamilnaduibacter salinus]PVY70309.1 MSHA biogenesis protein MshJ [Tamilnaduibacter salinus]